MGRAGLTTRHLQASGVVRNDTPTLYQEGDTWFRDMKPVGLDNTTQPRDRVDDSLSWLSEQIVADPRFATSAIKFWWPAIMGSEALSEPEVASDPNYDAQMSAYQAQELQISLLASVETGLIAREMLADMILSPWFRVKAAAT